MDWLCAFIGAALVVVLVVTLVGHGIWVVLARIFSSGQRAAPRRAAVMRSDAPVDELAATEAQMGRLLDAGLLDQATHDRVVGAVRMLRVCGMVHGAPPPVPVMPVAGKVPVPRTMRPLVRELQPASAAPPAESSPLAPISPLRGPITTISPAIGAPLIPPRPKATPAPRKPRRPMSEILAGFMHQSNIRWGELIGGLLIIGCSIALVVSFWSQIAGKPFFQFGIFTAVTAALMGLGLYAEHRWKLPTTSRGILLIATLLVPLNFLAFAALSHGGPALPLVTASELAVLVLFGFLVDRAAKVLCPYWPGLTTGGVVGICASLLCAKHLGPAHSPVALWGLGVLPAAIYGATIGVMLARAARWKRIRAHAAEAMFVLLGMLSFGTALALGLVIFQTAGARQAAHQLAPLLSLAAIPALAAGLILWRGITDAKLARLRTAGTSVAVAAALLMLGAIGLAWPDPGQILPLAVIDFAALTAIGALFDISAAHLLAGPCLLLAYLLGFEVACRHLGWSATPQRLLEALRDPAGGTALAAMSLLIAAAAAALSKWGKLAHAWAYWLLAAFAALISLALVSAGGFGVHGDPYGAAWVYLFYAAAAVIAALRTGRSGAGWASCLLLLAGFVQFFITRTTIAQPWAIALLAFATLAIAARLLIGGRVKHGLAIVGPAKWTALAASVVAMGLLLVGLSTVNAGETALRVVWIAGLWFAVSIADESGEIFIAAQLSLFLAAGLEAFAQLSRHSWFKLSDQPLLEPWTLQTIGLTLALLALGFTVLRLVLPSSWRVSRCLRSPHGLDRIVTVALGLGLAVMVLWALVPGLEIEYATRIGQNVSGHWASAAIGHGSWLLLGTVLLTLCLWAWENLAADIVQGLTAMAFIACPLWAARWSDVGAAGSALRWAAALFLVAGSVPLWLRGRTPGTLGRRLTDTKIRREARALLVVICAIPIIGLSLYPAGLTLSGYHLAWPRASCFFGAIGNPVSYVVPLLVLAVVFVANAIRERSPSWALAASGVLNLTVTLGYALAIATRGQSLGLEQAIRLVQLNVIALAVFSVAWQIVRTLLKRSAPSDGRTPWPVQLQNVLASAGMLLLMVPAGVCLFLAPGWRSDTLAMIGDPLGWAALGVTIGAMMWRNTIRPGRISSGLIGAMLAALVVMAALAAEAWGQNGWISYHLAMAGMAMAAAAMAGVGLWIHRAQNGIAQPTAAVQPEFTMPRSFAAPPTFDPRPVADPAASDSAAPVADETAAAPIPLQYQRDDPAAGRPAGSLIGFGAYELGPAFLRWTGALSALAVLLAVRAMAGDPQRPWWSVSVAAVLSLLWIGAACWTGAPRLLYAGGALLNLAATFWCIEKLASTAILLDLVLANVGVLALFGLASLIVHLHVFVPMKRWARMPRLPFHRFAAGACALTIAFAAAILLWSTLNNQPLHPDAWLLWGAWAAGIAIAAATLWDPNARRAIVELYTLGLAGIALALGQWPLPPNQIQWAAALLLAAFVVATGTLAGSREALSQAARRVGMALPEGEAPRIDWLLPMNLILAALVVALTIEADFMLSVAWLRLSAAAAALVQIIGLLINVRGEKRPVIREAIIAVAVAAAIACVWAWMPPIHLNPLDRGAASLVVLAFSAAVFLAASGRAAGLGAGWSAALRNMGIWTGIAGAINLGGIIGLELTERFMDAHVAMASAAVAATVLVMLAAAGGAVLLALRRGADPLGLPESRRGIYIYGAESVLALAFVHLRLTMPWLFGGVLAQYWPLVVMALAFTGVGVSELLRLRNLRVISDPLMQTGTFLPLLPVLAFWLAPSHIELSTLLFTVGFFYAVLSAARRSFALGIVAALAANGGLWAMFHHHPQLAFLLHPQIWLIPVALSVLAAAQLNRERLTPPQLRFARYCCLMVIYVSSTADVFLNGVRQHPWLPLVLAALSVGGVMAGILLRLRAFLFLGTAFLTLSIVTMIYYASANFGWTWLWYVAGIVLGAAIIATFALFEKKRSEMTALVEGLKLWQ